MIDHYTEGIIWLAYLGFAVVVGAFALYREDRERKRLEKLHDEMFYGGAK